MEDGQVMEYGSHEELMDKEGLYHHLVMNQMFVDETGYSTAEGGNCEFSYHDKLNYRL